MLIKNLVVLSEVFIINSDSQLNIKLFLVKAAS